MLKNLCDKYKGQIYLDAVVTNDDTKMKKYITHAKYKPKG